MTIRRIFAAVTATTIWLLAGTALAADHTVHVGNDKTLSPGGGSATIAQGDTVVWQWVGPDTDHIIASNAGQLESWDSDPGVQDINHAIGHTFSHTFTHTGSFGYRCRIHPDKMFGAITVTNPAPTASFTATPSSVMEGSAVSFDASASTAPQGRTLTLFEWDLDGNGSFETATGTTPTTARAYPTAGTFTVGLRVTDSASQTGQTNRIVTVTAPPPPAPPAAPAPPTLGTALLSVAAAPAPPAVAKLTLTGLTRQRKADTKGVAAMATCDLGCTVTAIGSITLPGRKRITLARSTKSLPAGVQTKIVLAVPKAKRVALKKALAKGKPLTASITVTTGDGVRAKRSFTLIR